MGLSRLTVCSTRDGELETIHLVPYEFGFDPTSVTREIGTCWLEALGGVEEPTNRVQTPQFEPEASHAFGAGFLVAGCLILPVMVVGLIGWFVNSL